MDIINEDSPPPNKLPSELVFFLFIIKHSVLTHKLWNVHVKYFTSFFSSASNRIVAAKDHASVQINIADVSNWSFSLL